MASSKTLRGASVVAALSLVCSATAFLACGSGDDEGASGRGASNVTGSQYTPVEAAAQPPIPPGAGPAPPGPEQPDPVDAAVPPKDAALDAPIVDAAAQ